MNNYIPLNRAVGPVCIYDGSEPLIDKKLGVEATECRFDGSAFTILALKQTTRGFSKSRVRKSASKMVFPLTDAWNWPPGQET